MVAVVALARGIPGAGVVCAAAVKAGEAGSSPVCDPADFLQIGRRVWPVLVGELSGE